MSTDVVDRRVLGVVREEVEESRAEVLEAVLFHKVIEGYSGDVRSPVEVECSPRS